MVYHRINGKVDDQKIAYLPKDCLLPDKTTFTNNGVYLIAYFGSLYVKQGKGTVKMYDLMLKIYIICPF